MELVKLKLTTANVFYVKKKFRNGNHGFAPMFPGVGIIKP
jgi:hypothetical protein